MTPLPMMELMKLKLASGKLLNFPDCSSSVSSCNSTALLTRIVSAINCAITIINQNRVTRARVISILAFINIDDALERRQRSEVSECLKKQDCRIQVASGIIRCDTRLRGDAIKR